MQRVSTGGLFDDWLARERLKATAGLAAAEETANEPNCENRDDRPAPASEKPERHDRDDDQRAGQPRAKPYR